MLMVNAVVDAPWKPPTLNDLYADNIFYLITGFGYFSRSGFSITKQSVMYDGLQRRKPAWQRVAVNFFVQYRGLL